MSKRQKAAPLPQTTADAPSPWWSGVRGEWLLGAGLILIAGLTYLPVLQCGFINFDDDVYVTNRPELQYGLTEQGITWAWKAVVSLNWHPLTLMSLLMDHDLSLMKDPDSRGLNPWNYHLTNLLLHLANTLLVFRCLRALTGEVGRSAVVAALFALHPLHVEAVAWIGDRTDLLSTFFGLLALRAYVWYSADPSWLRMAATTGLLALSFLAKPVWITFPFLLLLLDYWPLRRLEAGVSWRRLVVEKIPLFLIVGAGSVVALVLHGKAGALEVGARHSFTAKAGNALVSYAQYLRQTFVPTDLAIVYPHPGESLSVWAVLSAGLLLTAISALVIVRVRSHPEWFVGWFWFLGTLLPLIGLVQFREEARADRYTYVAHIGLFLALTWAVADGLKRLGRPAWTAMMTGTILLVCVLYTRMQLACWKDSYSVWEQALRVTSGNARAHNNYGEALWQEAHEKNKPKLLNAALEQYDAYVNLRPDDVRGYRHRGNVLFELYAQNPDQVSLLDRAIADYQKALELDNNLPDIHLTLGAILLDHLVERSSPSDADRLLAGAAAHFRAALASASKDVQRMAWFNLGRTYLVQKRFPEADKCYDQALDLPDDLSIQVKWTDALAGAGRFPEAIALLDRLRNRSDVRQQPEVSQDLEKRRRSFEKKQPYRGE